VATYHAIAATGQAIIQLLTEAWPRDEFPKAKFELYQFNAEEKQLEEGILLHLYRVSVNAARRNTPPTFGRDGRASGPLLPLELYYLLIPFGTTPDTQQRLLGWAMRVLEDTPVLPSGMLNYPGPETDTFRPNETVELVFDPISLQDMSNIWDIVKPKAQLCVPYMARIVEIESQVPLTEARPVQTRVFDSVKRPML